MAPTGMAGAGFGEGGRGSGKPGEVMRRKLAAARAARLEGGPGADRGWRLALARAANDAIGLPLEVVSMALSRRTVGEILELAPEQPLIAVLEGPGEGLGVLLLSPPVLSAMIEVQTIGRVRGGAAPMRKPTRTDAWMVVDLIDRALADLEAGLETEEDLIWAGGFRYASFLDDLRPLGLLLDEEAYRVALAEVRLAGGVRSGQILLALPAEGRGRRPVPPPEAVPEPVAAARFATALEAQVMQAEAEIAAVLQRVTVPLSAVMGLAPGQIVPLPAAALDKLVLQGPDGRPLATARLGQNRGMRAVRLVPDAVPAVPAASAVLSAPVAAETLPTAGAA